MTLKKVTDRKERIQKIIDNLFALFPIVQKFVQKHKEKY
jgi:lipid A disaccharide synthetase